MGHHRALFEVVVLAASFQRYHRKLKNGILTLVSQSKKKSRHTLFALERVAF